MTDDNLIRKWRATGLLEIPKVIALELARVFELLSKKYLISRQNTSNEEFRNQYLIFPLYAKMYYEGKKVNNIDKFIRAVDNSSIDEDNPESVDKFIKEYKE